MRIHSLLVIGLLWVGSAFGFVTQKELLEIAGYLPEGEARFITSLSQWTPSEALAEELSEISKVTPNHACALTPRQEYLALIKPGWEELPEVAQAAQKVRSDCELLRRGIAADMTDIAVLSLLEKVDSDVLSDEFGGFIDQLRQDLARRGIKRWKDLTHSPVSLPLFEAAFSNFAFPKPAVREGILKSVVQFRIEQSFERTDFQHLGTELGQYLSFWEAVITTRDQAPLGAVLIGLFSHWGVGE